MPVGRAAQQRERVARFLRPTYSNEQLARRGRVVAAPLRVGRAAARRGARRRRRAAAVARRGGRTVFSGGAADAEDRASTPGVLRRSSAAADARAPPRRLPRAQPARGPTTARAPRRRDSRAARACSTTKRTRYASERKRHGGDDAPLRRELEKRGIAWQTLRRSAGAHEFAFREITRALEAVGADVTVVDAGALDRERVAAGGFDLMLAAGGGGTVLRAAACIPRARRRAPTAPSCRSSA